MSAAQSDSRHLPISWGKRGESARAGILLQACVRVWGFVCVCVCVCPRSRASIRATCSISTSPCTVVPPQMLIAALESHHRDLTACWCWTLTPPCSASNLHIRPLWEARWYTLLRISVGLIGTHLFFFFFFTLLTFLILLPRMERGAVRNLLRHVRPRGALALSVPAVWEQAHE